MLPTEMTKLSILVTEYRERPSITGQQIPIFPFNDIECIYMHCWADNRWSAASILGWLLLLLVVTMTRPYHQLSDDRKKTCVASAVPQQEK